MHLVYESLKIGNIETFGGATFYLLNTFQLKARKRVFINKSQLVYIPWMCAH